MDKNAKLRSIPLLTVFAWLGEVEQLKVHLTARTFESLLDRYAVSWANPGEPHVASAPPAQKVPARVNIDFPTAASIPPVEENRSVG